MRKLTSLLMVFAIINLMLISCNKDDEVTLDPGPAPELPPYESMVIDFSEFLVNDNTEKSIGILSNYQYAAWNVGVFNLILSFTLAVPVASFYHSFSAEAEFISDATWQWKKSYETFGATYNARLTGKVNASNVKWEMYIAKEGIGAFDEFKWYEGTSDLDGNGGQWILNHSQQFQEPMLQIDWEKTGEEIGDITYTYIRELINDRTEDEGYGSYVQAGIVEGDLNAFYNIHLSDTDRDVFIEWSTTEYYGRVHNDTMDYWLCWDGEGNDDDCGE